MKKSFAVIVTIVGMAVLGVASSPYNYPNQSTVTPSPTWNIRTPPYTPTSGGAVFFPTATAYNQNCFGVPSGWGTVTPGALWNMLCESCVPTATLYPTYGFPSAVAGGYSLGEVEDTASSYT